MINSQVKLGNVIKLEYGKGLDKSFRSDDGVYLAYGANGVKARTDKYLYSKPSIIVGRKGSAGELVLVKEKFWALDVTFYVTHDESKTDLTYLYYALQGKNLKSLAKGIKPGINRNDVYELQIWLPSLATQQKIVEKLNLIFTEIDKAAEAAKANVKNAESLFQSYLTEIFECENSELMAIPIGRIGEIISGSGFPVNNQGLLKEEIPFYKVSDMNLVGNEKFMISHNNSISRETAKQLGAKIIPAKSVIFPKIGGAIATNKKRILSVPSCVDNNVMGITPNEKLVNPEFFFHLLSSIKLSSFAVEAALPSIKKSTVEERVVKIPKSLSEQERICEIVDSLKGKSSSLIDSYSRKCNNLLSLKQSILRQALSGQLVKEL